jgi:predicted transcriptional regulator
MAAAHTARDDVADAPPALTALLDHLAEELAREYVRLMEDAAQEAAAVLPPLPEDS